MFGPFIAYASNNSSMQQELKHSSVYMLLHNFPTEMHYRNS